jgi:hypothetical protein
LIIGLLIITSILSASAYNEPVGGVINPATYAQSRIDIIPHSPEAEALGKYGVLPVTLYSGMPEISIPLFEIKTPSITVPFTLQYNYNGCKPNEMASSIGLGWNLSGTGVIMRIIKGQFDENMGTTGNFDSYVSLDPLTVDQPFLTKVGVTAFDAEPDEFVFNVGKYRGNFIIMQGKAYVSKCSNISIIPLIVNGSITSFTLIDDDGNKYTLADAELTHGKNIPSHKSAWYVSNIISANKQDTINFTYTGYTYQQPTTIYDSYSYTQSDCAPATVVQGTLAANASTGNFVDALLLQSVRCKYSSINFALDTVRQDLPGSTNAKMVSSITMHAVGSQLNRQIKLNHSYFTNNSRLKLNSVTLEDPGKSYSFSYEDATFPEIASRAIDLSGYYNGQDRNTNLFPQGYFVSGTILSPANRDANMQYGKIGILKSIKYPTGGSSVFTWEQNKIGHAPQLSDGPGLRIQQIASYDNKNPTNSLFTDTYTYNDGQEYTTDAITSLGLENKGSGGSTYSTCFFASVRSALSDYSNEQFYYNKITKTTQSTHILGKTDYTYTNSPYIQDFQLQTKIDYKYSNGQFFPVASKVCQYQYLLKNSWRTLNASKSIMLGGSCNSTTNGWVYALNSPDLTQASSPTEIYSITKQNVINISYTLLSQEINTVYDTNGQNGAISQTDYYYDNPNHYLPTRIVNQNSMGEQIITQLKYPFDYNWGALTTPDAINETYKSNIQTAVNSFYTSRNALLNELTPYQPYSTCTPENKVIFSGIVNKYHYVNDFHDASNNAIVNRNASLSSFTTGLNTGIANSSIPWQKAVLWMQLNNVITPVIEKYVSIKKADGGEFLVSATRNEFLVKNNNAVVQEKIQQAEIKTQLPKSDFLSNTDNYYKLKYTYTYDSNLKLITQIGQDNFPTNYLWGYNGLYPVVAVEGSDYSTISGLVNKDILNNVTGSYTQQQIMAELQKIRTGLSGITAMTKTYTYDPFWGMTSATDPHGVTTNYIYDNFGRLVTIYNDDNNISQNYNYHYFTTYYNAAISQTLTKNNCPACNTASQYVYTVAAGKYSSVISQADADQQAQNEINTQGQTMANNAGTCTATCSGVNRRCINGNCETGFKVYIASYPTPGGYSGQYTCVWVYEFSDGSCSSQFTEIVKGNPCSISSVEP